MSDKQNVTTVKPMAMTEAERKRLSRQRAKDAEKAAIKSAAPVPDYLKRAFADFIRERELMLFENLDAFGVEIAGTLGEPLQSFPSEFRRDEPLTSLQRTVGLIDTFIEAAQELAYAVNVYKLGEIERAIDEAVEASSALPRDAIPELKASFAEIDRLKAIRSDLRRPTRHTVLAYKAKGE